MSLRSTKKEVLKYPFERSLSKLELKPININLKKVD